MKMVWIVTFRVTLVTSIQQLQHHPGCKLKRSYQKTSYGILVHCFVLKAYTYMKQTLWHTIFFKHWMLLYTHIKHANSLKPYFSSTIISISLYFIVSVEERE